MLGAPERSSRRNTSCPFPNSESPPGIELRLWDRLPFCGRGRLDGAVDMEPKTSKVAASEALKHCRRLSASGKRGRRPYGSNAPRQRSLHLHSRQGRGCCMTAATRLNSACVPLAVDGGQDPRLFGGGNCSWHKLCCRSLDGQNRPPRDRCLAALGTRLQ